MKSIGNIRNSYGGLSVLRDESKFYWSIKNWDGHEWEEIPEYLYQALIKFEEEFNEIK